MSANEYLKKSWTFCRISGCHWTGNITHLEHHFNLVHPRQLFRINNDSYFELTFNDLENHQPILLSTNNGFYWFAMNQQEQRPELFARGIFAIGDSERIQYHIKLGTLATRIMEILGPFETSELESDRYEFNMRIDYMQHLRSIMTPKVIIYFGDFEEEADEVDELGQLLPPPAITENIHMECKYSTFMCTTCVKLISGVPILFRDRHYLCSNCHHYALFYMQTQEYQEQVNQA